MSPAAPEAEKPKKPAASKSPDRVTPMMAQFLEIKAAHADALLFYRMGDFYELFFDDAVAAAAALDITLTHRGTHLGQAVPMCGVPYHASEGYLQRLIKAGFRVAICEQTEDPAAAKKRGAKSVVRREVVRLVTAGTLSEETLLDAKTDNFIAAIACLGNVAADAGHGKTAGQWAVAWADMSTGGFFVAKTNRADLSALLARLAPREIIIPDAVAHAFSDASADSLEVNAPITASINASANPPMLSPVGDLASPAAADAMRARFGVACHDALTAEGAAEGAVVTLACAHILAYFEATQYATQITLSAPRLEGDAQIMALDAATRSNLELNRTLSGTREGSLLAAIDESVTAAGARLLAARLNAPLTERAVIEARLTAVGVFVADADLAADIRAHLKTTPDMARALNRLAMQRGGPRDVAAIAQGLGAARAVAARLLAASVETSHGAAGELATQIETLGRESQKLADMGAHLSAALDDSLPLLARDGGFIRSGFHAGLDEARALRDESRRIIAALQNRYCEETGIKALKIKHNGVLGFHIDVPAAHGDKLMRAPHDGVYIHRQTLASSVRFSSAELAELAGQISRAGETALALELDILADLTAQVLAARDGLDALSAALAIVDVSTALAQKARAENWVAPKLYDDCRFVIEGGRHPAVEAALRAQSAAPFIANPCVLDAAGQEGPRMSLLTGPNMAGKSTFLRQNALIAIIAQMGSFVPAAKADIGIVDRVYSRVGAADDLARGRSTFMGEMVETAAILTGAGPRALVILDEIGRGTASLDGLSLAWAAVEYLHEVIGCRTLFATHYHELTALADRLNGLANASMKVREHEGKLVFLHEVGAGAADRSYGIHVAELAGLPDTVTARARHVLAQLEENNAAGTSAQNGAANNLADALPLFEARPPQPPKSNALHDAVTGIDPDRLSPREALDWLYRLQEIADNKGDD
ncbi:MAG: DNA mismatch repair protein MutS [Alphaproteobacteria bacterium]|nr:DNA mismatch repair protein MutS [Alphaproteobacteria bacterium]